MELRGKTILITRAATQSEDLRTGLVSAGARVIECPAIEIVPVDDWTDVDRAILNLQAYQWLILTSANAVNYFMERVRALGVTCRVPIATVGPSTASKLEQWDLKPTLIPKDFRAEGLLAVFDKDLTGVRILFPRAETAREILPDELRRRGAKVDVVVVYRTLKPSTGLADLRSTLTDERIDAVVFTSPSAVRYVSEALGDELAPCLQSIPIAVIGPVAREALEGVGLKAEILPERATMPDLVDAIRTYFSSRTPNT